ncbi:Ubiquitin carboxyl-terminal hydrolase family protein [Forsythia ovata]|uniref:Ubiquitin carboxyl-terminal hydrolase family protein n=1 Tax=Forsythia ovata TaxID=205694 RepID=A0ABD1WFB5_9LAMI
MPTSDSSTKLRNSSLNSLNNSSYLTKPENSTSSSALPRGRKVIMLIQCHPLIFQTYRHMDDKMWFGFTEFMGELLGEEHGIMNELERERVNVVRKLLMIYVNKRIPLSKIYHTRLLFGIPEDFRDMIANYPNYFRVVVKENGKRVLELVNWDLTLALSALEKEFLVDEDKGEKKLNMLSTLHLALSYSDGSKLDLWTLEAEKYRVGVIHEFLSLTLEKKAYIHNIVEFKDEFSLT